MPNKKSLYVIAACALLCSTFAAGQVAQQAAAPATSIISTYRVAPGKHLDFLKWMATREAVSRDAGVPVGQWYVHLNGDSWDFIHIMPEPTPEQDAKVEELERKKGLKTGFAGALELRQYMASHTDTIASGPSSAADLVKAAGGS
ncbi:MAG TPA: hypothetical protein VJ011_09500 [Steroidobacteraceae bacterium]|nr:hypothetical protein [Steroidobacteraceae bacterium]